MFWDRAFIFLNLLFAALNLGLYAATPFNFWCGMSNVLAAVVLIVGLTKDEK